VATLALLTACSSGSKDDSGGWVAQPNYQGNNDPQPQLPNPGMPAPSVPGGSQPVPAPSGSAASPGASAPAIDPSVVATKLNQPTGLVVLPDGTALVGERTTGKIFRVQPVAGKPAVLVQTVAGVDGTGDGGLLDLALSPTFNEDGLVYAYVTTATDNRVLHFALGAVPSAVIAGIPKGKTGNAGRIAFDATGALLTGTGDAGRPALAASPTSLAGKILRTNDIGQPLPDNPSPTSRVYARGLRSVDGLCVDAKTGMRIAISATSGSGASRTPDEVNIVKAGADYGWPRETARSQPAAKTLPTATPGGGGCAASNGSLAIATSAGKSLVVASVSTKGVLGVFAPAAKAKYGRLRTVVASPDGALWVTTRNRDGHGKPTADDDRVIRIVSSSDSGSPIV
jgi:glucose/arabinose dehydrogenase